MTKEESSSYSCCSAHVYIKCEICLPMYALSHSIDWTTHRTYSIYIFHTTAVSVWVGVWFDKYLHLARAQLNLATRIFLSARARVILVQKYEYFTLSWANRTWESVAQSDECVIIGNSLCRFRQQSHANKIIQIRCNKKLSFVKISTSAAAYWISWMLERWLSFTDRWRACCCVLFCAQKPEPNICLCNAYMCACLCIWFVYAHIVLYDNIS